jgi:cell division protease FtsH
LQVPVGLPDLNGRKAVFERYLKGMKLGPGIDAEVLARQTPGTAGADIEYIVNRASLEAGFKGEKEVSMERFMEALDERAAGLKRKILMTAEEKRVLAYHEGGHALMSHLLPDADPVRKVTVVSAGLQALGYMQAMPEEERHMYSRKWLLARMAVAFGGRVGEEIATGEKFSGASNDIQQASSIARAMVMEFGMSEKVGPIAFDHLYTQHKAGTARSEEMNRLIDAEVKALIDEAMQLAKTTLTANRATLDQLAAELQEKETLRGPDLERIIPGAKKAKEPK